MESTNVGSWRTASYSSNGGGECVEVGESAAAVLVRDTQNRDGGLLTLTQNDWRRFTSTVRQHHA